MSALVRKLGDGLQVRHAVRVTSLTRESNRWSVLTDSGDTLGPFDEVVVAVPAPQALPLVTASAELSKGLHEVVMPPCWAAMVAFEERLPLEVDGAFVRRSPLSWIARDSSKPGRPRGEESAKNAG